jgi:hypothetical protein
MEQSYGLNLNCKRYKEQSQISLKVYMGCLKVYMGWTNLNCKSLHGTKLNDRGCNFNDFIKCKTWLCNGKSNDRGCKLNDFI